MEAEVAAASERVGEREELRGLRGLRSGLPLWAPLTQETVPLTEDVAEAAQGPRSVAPRRDLR